MTPVTPGGQLSSLMTKIGQCERAIKRDAYALTPEAKATMALMVVLVKKAQELMAAQEPSLTLDLAGEGEYGATDSFPADIADVRDSGSSGGTADNAALSSPSSSPATP